MINDPVLMDPRSSLKKYPREDNAFKQKGSLNFDLLRTKIFREREKPRFYEGQLYLALMLLGFLTGFVASLMALGEDLLFGVKVNLTNRIIGGELENMAWAYIYWVCYSVGFAFIGSVLCVYWAPQSTGSGMAELMCIINGIRIPNFFTIPVLVTKCVAVVCAEVSGLCVGQEGPLAHIGASIAMSVVHLPIRAFAHFRNDKTKRFFITAGVAAGIASAFGSPVGGALIAYELSKPNTFFKMSTLWKLFLTASISVLTLAAFTDIWDTANGQKVWAVQTSVLKFGYVGLTNPTFETILPAIILGVVCGLLGVFFIVVQSYMGMFRKNFVKIRWLKPIETTLICFFTASFFFWAPYLSSEECLLTSGLTHLAKELATQYNCPEGEYSPLATLFFSTEGSVVRGIISGFEPPEDGLGGLELNARHMFVFFSIWYLCTIVTYGVNIPGGLFLPGMIIGCALGSCYETLRINWFDG